MRENPESKGAKRKEAFTRTISEKAGRKLKARRSSPKDVLKGLGMIGMIGWSVAMPTLLGAGLGLWLDNRHPGRHFWTLTLLIIGLVVGSLNGWHWIAREDKEMREEENNDE